jgi:hypothetical protein
MKRDKIINMIYEFLRPAPIPNEIQHDYSFSLDRTSKLIASEVRFIVEPSDNQNGIDAIDNTSTYTSSIRITKIIIPYMTDFKNSICIFNGCSAYKYYYEEFYYSDHGIWVLPTDIFIDFFQICLIKTYEIAHIYAVHIKKYK